MLRLAVVGAGNRGAGYARIAAASGRAEVVAVADPDEGRRTRLAEEHGIPDVRRFRTWQELVDAGAAGGRLADAAVVATQDAEHVGPAVALAEQGYHLLLEKPMATTAADARRIVDVAAGSGVTLAVCHVLRYTPYTRALHSVLDSGVLGDVVSVEHLEPVGWWHQAHSFVRGNWRREDASTFMLMAKSVHDLDWLQSVVRAAPERVSSFGGLHHFRRDRQPAGAADRCLDCAVEPDCPYSAPKIYLPFVGDPAGERWPLATITDDVSRDGVLRALREGPYGRCVYTCDNDVVDHQVVAVEYAGGATVSFTMTAFTPHEQRHTRVFGTHGYAEGDGARLSVLDFRTGVRREVPVDAPDDMHGGGDAGLVHAFVDALLDGRPELLVPAAESLAAHELVWAAERARRTGTVVGLAG